MDGIPSHYGRAELSIMGLPKRGRKPNEKPNEKPINQEDTFKILFDESSVSEENIS